MPKEGKECRVSGRATGTALGCSNRFLKVKSKTRSISCSIQIWPRKIARTTYRRIRLYSLPLQHESHRTSSKALRLLLNHNEFRLTPTRHHSTLQIISTPRSHQASNLSLQQCSRKWNLPKNLQWKPMLRNTKVKSIVPRRKATSGLGRGKEI